MPYARLLNIVMLLTQTVAAAQDTLGQEPAVFNVSPDSKTVPNSATSPVKPGGVARIRLPLPRPASKASVLIGGSRLAITQRRIVDGAHELTVRIPANTTEGCYVPIHLIVDGALQANSIPIAISSSENCKSYFPAWETQVNRKIGIVLRINRIERSLENPGIQSAVDVAAGFFDGDATVLTPGFLLKPPPPGLCSSQQRSGTPAPEILLPMIFDTVNGVELDVGQFLTLDDGRYQMQVPRVASHVGLFWKTAASSKEESRQIHAAGNLNLRLPGGNSVSPAVATLPAPAPFEWVNRPQSPLLNVRRTIPINWKANPQGFVVVAAAVVNQLTEKFSYCVCVASKASSEFNLPSQVMDRLVTSTGADREIGGMLYLLHIPDKVGHFQSAELAHTAILSVSMDAARVLFRR